MHAVQWAVTHPEIREEHDARIFSDTAGAFEELATVWSNIINIYIYKYIYIYIYELYQTPRIRFKMVLVII